MNDFVRAPKAYRELIIAAVRATFFHDHKNRIKIEPLSGKRKGVGVNVQDKIEACGCEYLIDASIYYSELRFFKISPTVRDPNKWAAYWVCGKGMKVYGDYDAFEKDIMVLKMT